MMTNGCPGIAPASLVGLKVPLVTEDTAGAPFGNDPAALFRRDWPEGDL
jgi:hypothetical protein